MIFDPIHIIPGYDIISLDIKYLIKYTIPFRLVNILIFNIIIDKNII